MLGPSRNRTIIRDTHEAKKPKDNDGLHELVSRRKTSDWATFSSSSWYPERDGPWVAPEPGSHTFVADIGHTRTIAEKAKAIHNMPGITAKCPGVSSSSTLPPRERVLDTDGMVISALWLDQPDYKQAIAQRLQEGSITAEEGKNLEFFAREGYVVIDDLDIIPFDEVETSIRDIFQQRSASQMAADPSINGGRPLPLSTFPQNFTPKPGTRLLEAESHSEPLMQIILNQKMHRYISLILEETPVATQSLYFHHGSTQPLHRDPWYVVTNPPGNMLASWLALEDVDPDSGPLRYVPGSHRLPYLPLDSTNDIVFHASAVKPEDKAAHVAKLKADMASAGQTAMSFAPRKGQALIWHANLVHGGSPVQNSSLTRKSFIVHYDALAKHPTKGVTLRVGSDGARMKQVYTNKLLEEDCRFTFISPLLDHLHESLP